MLLSFRMSGKTSSVPMGLARGGAVSLVCTAAGTAILAVLVAREQLSWEKMGYAVMVVLLLSAFLGAKSTYSSIRRQKLMVCLMSAFLYLGLLLAMTALCFGGNFQAVGETALLILAGAMCAALTGNSRHRQRRG